MHFDNPNGDWNELNEAFNIYLNLFSDPAVSVKSEYDMWRRKWEQHPAEHRPNSALAALDHCGMYPNITTLMQLLATLPVTTAEAERVFSKMDCTLTVIRATMEETRLEALLLLQVPETLLHHPRQ
jgi:hypothetical protein